MRDSLRSCCCNVDAKLKEVIKLCRSGKGNGAVTSVMLEMPYHNSYGIVVKALAAFFGRPTVAGKMFVLVARFS